ncbi:MAG: type II secretion system protein N [Casimicrobiaceae bacterium]
MRAAIAIVAGFGLLLLGLVVTAPATLIDGRLEAVTAGRVRLANATGTLWNGAGTVHVQPSGGRIDVGWHVEAMPLLWGELRGALLSSDDASPRATFAVSRGALDLRDIAASVPAETLLRAFGAPALVSAGGNVSLRSPALGKSGDLITGQVALRWDDAMLAVPGTGLRIALGEVHYDGRSQEGRLSGTLANTGGEVEITGTAGIAADGAARVNGTVRPRRGIDEPRAAAIAAALGLIGRPSGDGAFVFALS